MKSDKSDETPRATLQVATSRALSDDKDFQPNPHDYSGRSARFQADRDAFKHRFHDPILHAQTRPQDPQQGHFFTALEEERYLSQGYQRFPGAFKHLPKGKAEPDPLKGIIGYLRSCWSHKKSKKELAVSDNLKPLMDLLVEQRGDQEGYGKILQELLQTLSPPEKWEESKEKFEPSPETSEESQGTESSQSSALTSPARGQVRQKRRKLVAEEDASSPATSSQEPNLDQEPLEFDEVYHPYTRRFDKVIRADALVDQDERKRLKEQFQTALDETDMKHTNRLMTRLRAVLQSQSYTKHQFDQEQGALHHPRLSRLVTSRQPLVYKQMEEHPFLETTVTLLIDNSGSMRGRPIRLAAISAYLLAETLNKCSVSVEVLGFTTALWNGGKTRNLWVEAGKPPLPGRLNDLLHIVYKDSDTSWRKGKNQFGVMLKEGLLKENIDGEALLWAYHRLQKRNEPRKILIVISDGAPVDDATLAANPGNYLENHLRSTISVISRNKDVELLAIGIGHDVGQYYPRSVTLDSAEHLGSTLFEEMIKLFQSSGGM